MKGICNPLSPATRRGVAHRRKTLTLACAVTAGIAALGGSMAKATTLASDNADNATYSGGLTAGQNGGFGYTAFSTLDNGGGGPFAANASTGGRQIEGSQSFALFAGTGAGYSLARPLASTISGNGVFTYTVLGRHDLDNATAFSGFNLKSAAGATFGDSELLSFGLAPSQGNNRVAVTDFTGIHALAIGSDAELRGSILQYNVSFNPALRAYTLTVTDQGNGQSGNISGTFAGTATQVAALGFADFNSGTNQNLIFDTPTVVPEPASLGLLVLGGVGLLARRRRSASR